MKWRATRTQEMLTLQIQLLIRKVKLKWVFFRASVKTVARNEMEGDSNTRMLTLQIQLLIRKVKLKWVFFRASVKTVARNEMEGDSNTRNAQSSNPVAYPQGKIKNCFVLLPLLRACL